MRDIAYYNGLISTMDELAIPVRDRAVYFGDGIYDVIYTHRGVMFAPEDHLDRIYQNCQLMSFDFEMLRQELRQLLESLLARLDRDIQHVNLYIQVSRGSAPRTHAFPQKPCKANLLITASGFTPRSEEDFFLMSGPDNRFTICNIKTINLIPNILANQKAKEAGCEEYVFIRDGVITEGTHSNISLLKDGTLITPPLSNLILPSITRKHLLEICRAQGIPVLERHYTYEELLQADEVIVGSSLFLMKQATKMDGQPIGGKAPDTWQRIKSAYRERFEEETGPA